MAAISPLLALMAAIAAPVTALLAHLMGTARAARGGRTSHALRWLFGAEGRTLTAGEKQRLELARVLLRQPAVLVIDEGLSAVDPDTERSIYRRLFGADRRQSTIIIAHRLSRLHALLRARPRCSGSDQRIERRAGQPGAAPATPSKSPGGRRYHRRVRGPCLPACPTSSCVTWSSPTTGPNLFCAAVVGSSGSGKSTVARIVAGQQLPTSGELRIGRRLLHAARACRPWVLRY